RGGRSLRRLPMARPGQAKVTPVAGPGPGDVMQRVEDDRAVVVKEFEQDVERPGLAGELQGDVELVQRFAVAPQVTKRPTQVGARDDLVIGRAALLEHAHALADGRDGALRMSQ